MHQEVLLKLIRKKIGDKSLNDEIANILNISYDAAHRRTSLKAKFSFEEAMELAKNYQISLNEFLTSENQLIVQKTSSVTTTEDLQSFFQNNLNVFEKLPLSDEMTIYYSAKDIPFFYTLSDTMLSRFKIYVWMNLLNQDKFLSPFDTFNLEYHSIKNELLIDLYEKQNVTEIWNDTTILSALRQISFYFEIGLLKKNDTDLILDDLKSLIKNLEHKTLEKPNFQIFVNDLVILNNSILFKNEQQSSFFIPFSMFGYMMTTDEMTCQDSLSYFEHQIKNSKSLNASGNRDRALFFNTMYEQIESLKQKL